MTPVVVDRLDLGGGGGFSNPMLNVGVYLSKLARLHMYSQCVLMFHVTNDGAGYGAYGDDGEKFEQVVRNVKKYDGDRYIVVNYPDYSWKVEVTSLVMYRLRKKLRTFITDLLDRFLQWLAIPSRKKSNNDEEDFNYNTQLQ